MVDDPDTLRAHLDRLIELARHAQPEDRARLERLIELVSRAHQEVARTRQAAERARRLREEADANLVQSAERPDSLASGVAHHAEPQPQVAPFP